MKYIICLILFMIIVLVWMTYNTHKNNRIEIVEIDKTFNLAMSNLKRLENFVENCKANHR